MVQTRNGRGPFQSLESSQQLEQPRPEVLYHGSFDGNQAGLVQDLAKNGAEVPAAQMYSYSNTEAGLLNGYNYGGSNSIHSNGVVPANDFALDAFCTYYDADSGTDSAAFTPAELLDSLSTYTDLPTSNNDQISNDNFSSLLQAAATASGQDSQKSNVKSAPNLARQYTRSEAQLGLLQNSHEGRLTRKRLFEAAALEELSLATSRRTRLRDNPEGDDIDEEAQLRLENEIWGPEEIENAREHENIFDPAMYEGPTVSASEFRAMGIHPAAALFRRPSKASKKSTRPPISKMYTSLELTPNLFLHLQAAAKTYMLDPEHPERSDSVGSKGKSDTDLVKLKLFTCVLEFLEVEGWGEKCYGKNSEGALQRKLHWPAMKTKIISLVTPLLRRMVTNERQRLYALETRAKKTSTTEQPQTPEDSSRSQPQYQPTDPEGTGIESNLNSCHYNLEPFVSSQDEDLSFNLGSQQANVCGLNGTCAPDMNKTSLHYHLNIFSKGKRVIPKVYLTPATCPSFASLVQHVLHYLNDESKNYKSNGLHVHSAGGLIQVQCEQVWLEALKSVEENEWMDGDVKILLEVDISEKNVNIKTNE